MPSLIVTVSVPLEIYSRYKAEADSAGYTSVPTYLSREYLGIPSPGRGPTGMNPQAKKRSLLAEYALMLVKPNRTPAETGSMAAMRQELRTLCNAKFGARGELLDTCDKIPLPESAEPPKACDALPLAEWLKLSDAALTELGATPKMIKAKRKEAKAAEPKPEWKKWKLADLRGREEWELDMLGMSAEQIANLRAGKRP